MRLLISEAPQWRKFWAAGEAGIFCHDHGRLLGCNKKDVRRERLLSLQRMKFALRSSEIKAPIWLMDEHGSSSRADEPRDRNAASVCGKLVAALAALHRIDGTTPVE